MDKDKQRITIAESQEWEWCYHTDLHNTKCWGWEQKGVSYHQTDYYECEKSSYLFELPDYLRDLNTIHPVAMKIMSGSDGGLKYDLMKTLREVVPTETWLPMATAEQWCEAILKTLNLWTYE